MTLSRKEGRHSSTKDLFNLLGRKRIAESIDLLACRHKIDRGREREGY